MVYNKIIWIHRMTAILSELTSKVNISAWKDKLTEVYTTVNDKIIKVKDTLTEVKKQVEKSEEKKEEEKQESYAPPPVEKSTKDKIFDFLAKLKEYFIIAGTILLKLMFYIYLASLVANDMMMYPPVIRAFFFAFTLFVTYTFSAFAFFVSCYYALRRGYDYYHQNLSSEMPKPPLSFPMIFAILPLTTMYPESSIVRFFMWAFMYQKSSKPERMEKENNRLEVIMTEYWKDLNKSFDYLNKIKSKEPFSGFYKLNEEHLTVKYMHPIQKPDTVVESSNEENKDEAKDAAKDAASTENKAAPLTTSMASFAAAAASAFNLKPTTPLSTQPVSAITPMELPATAPPQKLVEPSSQP